MTESTRAYYDDFSGWYERGREKGYHALIDELELSAVAPKLNGATVLEAGCGTGLILERLAERSTAAYGIDLSKGMLSKARARGLNVALGSVTEVPFPSDTFDLVCSFKVLAHVEAIEQALHELTRVTKPGGWVAFEFYNPWSVRYIAKYLAGPKAISMNRDESHVFTRWDSPRHIQKLLPQNLVFREWAGVRVLTPAAFVYSIPGVAGIARAAERRLVRSPLRRFGGFLIALAQKQ